MKIFLPLALVLTVVLGYLAYSQRSNKIAELVDSEPSVVSNKRPQAKVEVALEPSLESAPAGASESAPKRPVATRIERHDLTQQPPVISQAELERRAAKVEQETNHELARLVQLLDLTEDQQDKIFATLAQNSPDYHPAMGLASANNQPLAFMPYLNVAAGNDLSTSGKGSQTTTETSRNNAAAIWDGTLGIGNLAREDVQTRGPVQGQVNQVTAPTANRVNSTFDGTTEPPAAAIVNGNNSVTNALNKTTTSIEDLVAPYLTGPQQNALSEEESDRMAWWAELTTNLAAGLETPAVDGTTSAPETITHAYDDSL